MGLAKQASESGYSPKLRHKQKNKGKKSHSKDLEIVNKNVGRYIVEGSSMPRLIPLICCVQILVHFLKTPNHEVLLFQFDPLRRYQLWRYLTPFLIHAGGGDGNHFWDEFHLWSNVLLQLLFGWRLEAIMKWRLTAIIYWTSVLSESLLSSALKPCEFSLGSSDALCGIMMANIVVHFMIPSVSTGLRWKSSCAVLSLTIGYPIVKHILLAYYKLTNFDVDNSSHIGGALGGGVAAVFLCSGYAKNKIGSGSWFKRGCFVFFMVYLIVFLIINLLYVHIFNYITINGDFVIQRLGPAGKYENFVMRYCESFWALKSLLWARCSVGQYFENSENSSATLNFV